MNSFFWWIYIDYLYLLYLDVFPDLPTSDFFLVELYSHVVGHNGVFFKPLQQEIVSLYDDSTLVFFRLYNSSSRSVHGVTTYTLFPYTITPFLNKIQCFCFEELSLKPCESLDLPVLFYIERDASPEHSVSQLSIVYTFFVFEG